MAAQKEKGVRLVYSGERDGQCCHLVVSVVSGGSVAGSSGELADDTDESSVLVFEPLVISAQINKDLESGKWE